MPTPTSTDTAAGVQVFRHRDPGTGRQITRVQFRGWQVHIDGASLCLPRHTLTAGQNPADLAVCLDAARSLRRHPHRRVPGAHRPAPGDDSSAVVAILTQARIIAASQWHPTLCDIYECTSTAWTNSGMPIGYATLTRTLRAALPEGTRLIDVNDTATREDICRFFDRAISLLTVSPTSAHGVVA